MCDVIAPPLLAFLGLVLWQFVPASTSAPPSLTVNIDYEAFLARADMEWAWNTSTKGSRWAPSGWYNSAYLGNGNLGMQIVTGLHNAANPSPPLSDQPALRFELGRLDITDDRMPGSAQYTGNLKCDRERLPIGHIHMRAAGKVLQGKMRLSLWNAELSASINTSIGSLAVSAFTHASSDINIIRISQTAGEMGHGCAGVEWVPVQGDALLAWQRQVQVYEPNPAITTVQKNKMTVSTQRLLSGNAYTTVLKMVEDPTGGCTVYQSTMGRLPNNESEVAAATAVAQAEQIGLASLRQSHQSWWHNYYPASFISLSDTRLETFYALQMYRAASGSRSTIGAPSYGVYDHHGPWFAPTPTTCCILFNWDMNIQATYWPFATANRLDISAALGNFLSSATAHDSFKLNTPSQWRNDSLAGPEGHSSYWLLNDPYLNPDWHPNASGWSPPGSNNTKPPSYTANLLWALHNYWRQYAYALDVDALQKIFPLLRDHMNMHLHMMSEGSDGYLHLPPSYSPEYNEKVLGYPGAGDTTYHLGLVRWGLERLLEGCAILKCGEAARSRWASTLTKLASFAVDDKGMFQVATNLDFKYSHRHFSHLFPCFPLGLVNATDPLCKNSADHWYHVAMVGPWDYPNNTGDWCIWSMGVLSSLSTLMDRKQEAWSNLSHPVHNYVMPNRMPFGSAFLPNGMYGEGCDDSTQVCGDPTGESPFVIASSLQDALLITDRAAGVIRVFGGVPASAPDIAFHQLRAEGGFLFSASRNSSRTEFVFINATVQRKGVLRVFPNFADEYTVFPSSAVVATHSEGWIGLTFEETSTVLLHSKSSSTVTLKPVGPETQYLNWWGYVEGRSAGEGLNSGARVLPEQDTRVAWI